MKKKEKSLQFFIDQKERELKEYTFELQKIRDEMENLLDRKADVEEEIEKIQNQPAQDIASLHNASSYILYKRETIAQIEKTIALLQEELSAIEMKVKECYAQKRGLEKLLRKNRDLLQAEESNKEGQLADESFIRKYIAR